MPKTKPAPLRLAFVASELQEAQESRRRLAEKFGDTPEEEADIVVALGGDGFMLEVFHRNLGANRAIYGMNRGSVGFLMNDYDETQLPTRIANAERAIIHPLRMTARTDEGRRQEAL